MSELNAGKYRPIYFLAGEETYYIDTIADFIENNALSESDRAFNQIILYGDDTNINNVIETARRFPMMAPRQVVIVREAQSLKELDKLTIYLDHPLSSTVLVFCHKYKALDKRLKLGKQLDKMGFYFESKKLRDYEVPNWIETFLSQRGVKSAPEAREMLTAFLGTDLHKIANELTKLIITLPKQKPIITTDIIENNIGISKDFNNFELQKAIGEKDIYRTNLIVKYFAENQKANPFILTIAALFSYFSKILTYHYTKDKSQSSLASALKVSPYFVKDYGVAARNYNISKTVHTIELLRKYDLMSKGSGSVETDSGELLREMIFKIIH